jgi:hypothetical protein
MALGSQVFAQDTGASRREVIAVAPAPTVSIAGGEVRITAGPGLIRCRALLTDIARLARVEIRNLAHVPDDEVYVEFSAEPLGSAIAKLLALTKRDFVVRGGYGTEPALVFVRSPFRPDGNAATLSSTTSATPIQSENSSGELPAAPMVDLPALESPAAGLEAAPPQVPLDVRPETVSIEHAPVWQPVDIAPVSLGIPPSMTPKIFPVSVPPPAAGARPGPSVKPPKGQ